MGLCEAVEKAWQALCLAAEDIREAHAMATPVAELILAVHLEEACIARDAMARLANALDIEETLEAESEAEDAAE